LRTLATMPSHFEEVATGVWTITERVEFIN
jgi:hypothetical protein